MNLTIAKAMLREQFQRALPILAISLGISTALCLVSYASLWWSLPNEDTEASMIATTFLAHVIGILGLLYCHSDNRDMQVAMPAYLLRLPVRTIDLVIFRMVYGMLLVALIGIWNSAIHYPLLSDLDDSSFGFWTPCLIGIMTYALFQSLAWSIGGLGIIVVVCASPTILLLSAALGFEIAPKTLESFESTRYTAQTVLAVLTVSSLIAYVGVRTRRSARIDFDRILSTLPSMFHRNRRVDLPPFTSPQQAMRWLEWRRQSRLLPLLVGVGSVVLVFPYLIIAHRLFQPSFRVELLATYGEAVALGCNAALMLGAVGFGAYSFFQNQRLQVGPLNAFLFIRPVATNEIAQTRIVVVLQSVLISMVPFLLGYAVAVLLVISNSESTDFYSMVSKQIELGGVGIALWLIGCFAIIWCFQWAGNLLAMSTAFGIASLFGMFLLLFVDVEANRQDAFVTAIAVWMTALVAIAVTTYAFHQALRRHLLEKKSFFVGLAACPLLVAGFAVYLNPDRFIRGEGIFEFSLFEVGLILALAIVPIVPLASVPLVMQFARHR